MILDIDRLTPEQLRRLLPPELEKHYLVYLPGLRHALKELAEWQMEYLPG